MTYTDTKEVLRRIKSNYQSFVNDDYVLKEWYKELKNYDLEDVMEKLEQHMRSEEYGSTIPKLYFLTKYLKKTKDKGIIEKFSIQCSICGEFVSEEQYDKHFERCLDVEYIVKKRKKLFEKDTDKAEIKRYKSLSEDIFDNKYLEFVDKIYNLVSKEEQEMIDKIILTKKRC